MPPPRKATDSSQSAGALQSHGGLISPETRHHRQPLEDQIRGQGATPVQQRREPPSPAAAGIEMQLLRSRLGQGDTGLFRGQFT